MKIAIIGSGISALTCAYRLQREHDIEVFEAAPKIGGHTATVDVAMGAKDVRDFEPLPGPVPDVSAGTHGLVLVVWIVVETVKRRTRIPEMVSREFEISQGGLNAIVA